jgi:hypothetical protein
VTAIHAEATEPTAKIAPTERSNPPAMMTSVIADAMIASGAFWLRMLSRFRPVRKLSDRTVSSTIRTPMTIRTA